MFYSILGCKNNIKISGKRKPKKPKMKKENEYTKSVLT